MLKNKITIITILTVIILALTLPIVRAEDEPTQDTPVATDATTTNLPEEGTPVEPNDSSEVQPNGSSETGATTDENFKKTDVYLTGDDVTIDYIVDGNLFVFANNVTINSQIGGDAFIFANSVTVGEQGYIFSNLFSFAKNVTVNGVVYDLYSAAETTSINGYIYRDIRVGSNSISILGTVGRNAYVDCNYLNFSQGTDENAKHGIINGNLQYSSKEEIAIPEGVVAGETNFEKEIFSDDNTIQDKMVSLVTFIVTVIVIWLICLWLAPKFLKNSSALLTSKKVLPVIGFGILTPIVAIILSVIFLILGITSTLSLLLIIGLILLMAIGTSIFVIAVNYIVCDKLKVQKTMGILGMLVASSIVLWAIGLIPVVGSIIEIIAVLLGLGIVISSIVLKDKKQETETAE